MFETTVKGRPVDGDFRSIAARHSGARNIFFTKQHKRIPWAPGFKKIGKVSGVPPEADSGVNQIAQCSKLKAQRLMGMEAIKLGSWKARWL